MKKFIKLALGLAIAGMAVSATASTIHYGAPHPNLKGSNGSVTIINYTTASYTANATVYYYNSYTGATGPSSVYNGIIISTFPNDKFTYELNYYTPQFIQNQVCASITRQGDNLLVFSGCVPTGHNINIGSPYLKNNNGADASSKPVVTVTPQ